MNEDFLYLCNNGGRIVFNIPINIFKINLFLLNDDERKFKSKCEYDSYTYMKNLKLLWSNTDRSIQEITDKLEKDKGTDIHCSLSNRVYFTEGLLTIDMGYYAIRRIFPFIKNIKNITNLLRISSNLKVCLVLINNTDITLTSQSLSYLFPKDYTFQIGEVIDYILQPNVAEKFRRAWGGVDASGLSSTTYYNLYYSKEYRSYRKTLYHNERK